VESESVDEHSEYSDTVNEVSDESDTVCPGDGRYSGSMSLDSSLQGVSCMDWGATGGRRTLLETREDRGTTGIDVLQYNDPIKLF